MRDLFIRAIPKIISVHPDDEVQTRLALKRYVRTAEQRDTAARFCAATGMRISVRYAFTNTLLAELIAANLGLGFLIEYYSGNFDTTGAYAAIMVIVALSVASTLLLVQTEKWALRWHS